jgi:N-methylhydantoinase B
LFGGQDGATGEFVLNPETAGQRRLKSKGLDVLQAGDLVSLRMPGAGGYGNARERSLDAIERDLRDGKVSIETAQSQYGVVVDRETLRVQRR